MKVWTANTIDYVAEEIEITEKAQGEMLFFGPAPDHKVTVRPEFTRIYLTEEDAILACLVELLKSVSGGMRILERHEGQIYQWRERLKGLEEKRVKLSSRLEELTEAKEVNRGTGPDEDSIPMAPVPEVIEVTPMTFSIGKLKNCPRCSKVHESLIFAVFTNPQPDLKYTHWALCPYNEEPILSRLVWEIKQFNVNAAETA